MKKFLSAVLVVALVCSLFVLPMEAKSRNDDNLLTDPSFSLKNDLASVWTNGWLNGNVAEYYADSHTKDGSGCLKMVNAEGTPNQHFTQPVTLEGGKTYKISGWIKLTSTFKSNAAGACGAYFAVNLPNESGGPSGQYAGSAGIIDTNDPEEGVIDGIWQYFESTYTPSEDMAAFFSVCMWGCTGGAFFDDVYIGEQGSKYSCVYLSDLDPLDWQTYKQKKSDPEPYTYEPWFNRQEATNSQNNYNIEFAGQQYSKGIQLHASKLEEHLIEGQRAGYVEYDISGYDYDTFRCIYGGITRYGVNEVYSDNSTWIEIDGVKVYVPEYEYLDNSQTDEIIIPIPEGAKTIKMVSVAGPNWTSEWWGWADAMLYYNNDVEHGYITLPSRTLSSEEGLSVTLDIPASHDNVESDWIGIYNATADENAITQADSLGIWCYIGTGTKTKGVAEGKHIELTLDKDLAEATTWSDGEIHWPLTPGQYKVMLFYNDSYTVEDVFYFTVEEDTPEATPEPTAEPTATPEPTAEPTATPEPTKEPAKTGCKSIILSGSAAIVLALAGAAVVFSKKRR